MNDELRPELGLATGRVDVGHAEPVLRLITECVRAERWGCEDKPVSGRLPKAEACLSDE